MPPAVARQGRAMQAKKQQVADGVVAQLNFHAREKAWLDAHIQVRQPSQVLTSHTAADASVVN